MALGLMPMTTHAHEPEMITIDGKKRPDLIAQWHVWALLAEYRQPQ